MRSAVAAFEGARRGVGVGGEAGDAAPWLPRRGRWAVCTSSRRCVFLNLHWGSLACPRLAPGSLGLFSGNFINPVVI